MQHPLSKDVSSFLVIIKIENHMNGHKITNQNSLHFVTFTVVGWVVVFTRPVYKDMIIEIAHRCLQHRCHSILSFQLKIYTIQ